MPFTLQAVVMTVAATSCSGPMTSPGFSAVTVHASAGQNVNTGDLDGSTFLELLIRPQQPHPTATGGNAVLGDVRRTGRLLSGTSDQGDLDVWFEVCPVVRGATSTVVTYQLTDAHDEILEQGRFTLDVGHIRCP